MNDFAKSAVARNARCEPVRAAIRVYWVEVAKALDQGASKKSIAAQLKADFGAAVGSNSGFNAALNHVIAEKGYVHPLKTRQSAGAVTSPVTVATVDVVPAIDAKPVVDTRRRMGWGGAS